METDADRPRLVQSEPYADPDSTVELISTLDRLVSEAEQRHPTTVMAGLAVRAQLATALATEHVALELALARELLAQVAERLT